MLHDMFVHRCGLRRIQGLLTCLWHRGEPRFELRTRSFMSCDSFTDTVLVFLTWRELGAGLQVSGSMAHVADTG